MTEFVLMLTHDDKTIPEARSVLEQVTMPGLTYVGFKDIGVEKEELENLVADMRAAGQRSMLEVVSLTEDDEIRSARMGVELGVDYLVGGTRRGPVQEIIDGTGVKYFPYVGEVVEHPAVLKGSTESIVEEARQALQEGADGINLLAYRHVELDGLQLARAVMEGVEAPVMCAGSVSSLEQVRALKKLGVWGFTIGGAVVQRQIVSGTVRDQVTAILETLSASGARAG
jgi:hypothetical protein